MRKGRDFDDRDDRNAPRVVIVNEALVRAFFPNEDPLGKRIRPGLSDDLEPIPVREIIGVVADAKSDDLASEPMPAVYMPHAQCPAVDMTLVLRGHGSADQMIGATRHAVTAIDMSVVLYQSHEMEHYLKVAVAQARLNSILMAIFASVAVVLTAIGVYGVMAYAVVQRTHEIGIRLALGAQKLTIFRLVVGQGVRLILWSLLFGIVCSVCAMPFLRPVINGDSISTPVIVVLVASLLGTIALVACWLPAQRAAEFDPLHAIGQR
jgi:putative ABC transport system permease protein